MKQFKKLNIWIAGLLALAMAGSGCLKDELQDDGLSVPKINTSPSVIELMGPVRATSSYNTSYAVSLNEGNKDTTFDLVPVRLAADEPASEDIQVTLELVPALIQAFNDTNHTHVVEPPAGAYTLSNSMVVTIPRGSREASLQMTANPANLISGEYGFAFRIKSVSPAGYTISGNFNNAVVTVGVKNRYDGIYSVVSGRVTRYTAPGAPANDALSGNLAGNPDVTMITSGANSVTFPPAGATGSLQWAAGNNSSVAGIDGLTLTVDPATNLITMTSPSNPTLANWAGKENRYDPATQTFYLGFRWNPAANVREYEVVLKYKGPR